MKPAISNGSGGDSNNAGKNFVAGISTRRAMAGHTRRPFGSTAGAGVVEVPAFSASAAS
jgi:hypothetical protein